MLRYSLETFYIKDEIWDYKLQHVPKPIHSIYQLLNTILEVCFFRVPVFCCSSVKKFIISYCWSNNNDEAYERAQTYSDHIWNAPPGRLQKKHNRERNPLRTKESSNIKDGDGYWRKRRKEKKHQPIRKTPGEKAFITTMGNRKSSWNLSSYLVSECWLKSKLVEG